MGCWKNEKWNKTCGIVYNKKSELKGMDVLFVLSLQIHSFDWCPWIYQYLIRSRHIHSKFDSVVGRVDSQSHIHLTRHWLKYPLIVCLTAGDNDLTSSDNNIWGTTGIRYLVRNWSEIYNKEKGIYEGNFLISYAKSFHCLSFFIRNPYEEIKMEYRQLVG